MPGKLAILNPRANKWRTARLIPQIQDMLQPHDVAFVETKYAGHATELALAAAKDGYSLIIGIGGDGTLSEVANGILKSGKPAVMGVVGAGSGNDYAQQTLKLPKDPLLALQHALHGAPRAIDMARINDRYFQNTFGVGIDANVAWDVAENLQPKSPFRGPMLYTASALRQIILYLDRLPVLTVTLDAEPVIHGRLLLGATNIGPTAGGGYRLNPLADPYDGYLDFCLARPMSRLKALVALQLLRAGKHTILPEVKLHRCKRIHLKAEGVVTAHIDGELMRGSEWEVEILPGALQVMLPRK